MPCEEPASLSDLELIKRAGADLRRGTRMVFVWSSV